MGFLVSETPLIPIISLSLTVLQPKFVGSGGAKFLTSGKTVHADISMRPLNICIYSFFLLFLVPPSVAVTSNCPDHASALFGSSSTPLIRQCSLGNGEWRAIRFSRKRGGGGYVVSRPNGTFSPQFEDIDCCSSTCSAAVQPPVELPVFSVSPSLPSPDSPTTGNSTFSPSYVGIKGKKPWSRRRQHEHHFHLSHCLPPFLFRLLAAVEASGGATAYAWGNYWNMISVPKRHSMPLCHPTRMFVSSWISPCVYVHSASASLRFPQPPPYYRFPCPASSRLLSSSPVAHPRPLSPFRSPSLSCVCCSPCSPPPSFVNSSSSAALSVSTKSSASSAASSSSSAPSPPASSSLELLKQLRALTNSSVSTCREALTASSGDLRAAVDWLRQRGSAAGAAAAAAASLSTDQAREGIVAVASWRAKVVAREADSASPTVSLVADDPVRGQEACVNRETLGNGVEPGEGGQAGAREDGCARESAEWEGKVMIKLSCNTDFVARNDQVTFFASRVALILANLVRRNTVENYLSTRTKETSTTEAAVSSVERCAVPLLPEAGPALVEHLLNASWSFEVAGNSGGDFPNTDAVCSENTRTEGAEGRKRERLVRDELHFLTSLVGERILIDDAATVAARIGEGAVGSYLHDKIGDTVGSIGVLVALDTAGKTGERRQEGSERPFQEGPRDGNECKPGNRWMQGRAERLTDMAEKVAMQAAAGKPLAVDAASLDPDLYEREARACRAQAEGSGKPPEVTEKMVAGRLKKWFKEVLLSEQTWLLDDRGKSVKDVLAEFAKQERFSAPVRIKKAIRFFFQR
ncbi:putative elongation factor TS [Toxoplasma gondii p89]|uniref:Elongation factor Ts, mitochondrial n=1 Tax=Toxoplasma gondii p89 TaxID=943119 RepID=A0A086J6R0_TOXGO|nr:putative elongation factor TS [Toxoplasma gondii p89]